MQSVPPWRLREHLEGNAGSSKSREIGVSLATHANAYVISTRSDLDCTLVVKSGSSAVFVGN